MLDSGGAVFAISIATAKVEPPDMPVIIPSALANLFAQIIPCSPETGISSSK